MTVHRTAYQFKALLTLFPTVNGGRKKPVYDHYRPSFSFGSSNHFSGEVSFVDLDELLPGGTAMAIIKLLPSRNIRQNLKSGDSFTILDGDKIVGTGVIQEIQEEHQMPVVN
ncbi:MAG TPA: hypothetical protein VFE54_10530 [Mucilaginibacter sp.]|jgi:translation elongation factor EF-Tu-like GTPase|nr:hypothetical protein [Mucilaginibacter sp.]